MGRGLKIFSFQIFSLIFFINLPAFLTLASEDPVDASFISFLSGTKASAPLEDTRNWKSQLLQHLKATEGKKKAADISVLKLSTNLPLSVRERLLRVEELYRKYRMEHHTSRWFRETQIPKAIDEAVAEIKKHRSLLPPEVCAPTEPGNDIERIFVRSEMPETDEKKLENPQATSKATELSATRPADYGPQKAAELAKDIVRAEQYDANPKVVSRKESGLAPAKADISQWSGTKEAPLTLKGVVFHHSAGGEDATIKTIQDSHLNANEWSDIGYHFAIDHEGNIFEGRSLEHQGAHAGPIGNQDTIGVVFIGNHHPVDDVTNPSGYLNEREGTPSPAAVKAAVSLLLALQNSEADLYKSTESIPTIKLDIQSVVGHIHHKATNCPGEACLPLVGALNEIAKGLVK